VSHGALQSDLRGVATGLVTPFDEDGGIDHEALATNARALYDRGIRAFFACGNISEYHALTHDERIAVTETSAGAVPDDATVLAGVGGAIGTAVDLGHAATEAGVDALMIMPPDHTFKHEAGLLDYYRGIGDSVDRPTVPYLRRFDPSVEFVARLSHLDPVAAIKYAIDDVPTFAEIVAAGADDVLWINGLGERHAVPLWIEGARGMASGVGNFEPAIGIGLYEALEAGEFDRAQRIRNAAVPYMNFRDRTGHDNTLPGGSSIPAVKAGLDLAGLTGGHVRPPLVDLDDAARDEARSLYDDLAAFIDTEL
jgi:4-hydroxy-tetrahydrodipicolinate synthase